LVRRPADEQGFGLVLVIGTMAVLLLLMATIGVIVINGLHNSSSHQRFTGALDAAEAGVDAALTQLNGNPLYSSAGVTLPANVAAHGWSSASTEYTWAHSTLLSLAGTPSNLVTTPSGQYVAIRPAGLRTIYSMGWSPSYQLGTRPRLMKADYTFAVTSPHAALITATSTKLSGNFDVGDDSGVTTPPVVLSNGSIDLTAASAQITDSAGTSYSPTSNAGISIPTVDPRYVYQLYSAQFANSWYDLCPDGTVRRPNGSGVPCQSTAPVVSPAPAGWSYSSSTWTEGSVGTPGVYYVFQANATVNTNITTTAANQTVLTESSPNLACPKTNGNISVTKSVLNAFLPGVVLLSGNNLSMGNNSQALGGSVTAQDSMSLTTGSAPGVNGYVIAQDLCPGDATNSFQGTNIAYNPYGGFPTPQAVQVTAEAELLANS
jgi:hypothetical protein